MNEEKKQGLFVTMLVCIAILLCFGVFRKNEAPPPEQKPKSTAVSQAEFVTEPVRAAPCTYTVRLEEEKLKLYLNSDGETIFMESFPLSDEVFPSADIAELREGITVTGLDKCVGLIEDFTG